MTELYTLKIYETKIPVQRLIADFQNKEYFLRFCKECVNYNARWSCPALDFDVNEYLSKFQFAHLISAKIVFKKEVIDTVRTAEDINRVTNETIQETRKHLLEKLLELEEKYPSSVSIVSGGCNICKTCARTLGKPCIHPDKMRYSLNTFGFDITKLLKELFQIELIWSKGKLPEYYTLVSAFLTNKNLPARLLSNGCGDPLK